jgi:hypothetical protein
VTLRGWFALKEAHAKNKVNMHSVSFTLHVHRIDKCIHEE